MSIPAVIFQEIQPNNVGNDNFFLADEIGEFDPSEIWSPLDKAHHTRGRVATVEYRDLSEDVDDILSEEKVWAADHLIAQELLQGYGPWLSHRAFAERYNLSRSTIDNWVINRKEGKSFQCTGRPFSIDEEGLKALAAVVDGAANVKKAAQVHKIILNAIKEQRNNTLTRRGQIPDESELNRKTLTAIRRRLRAKIRVAQAMNETRLHAASDHRNAVSLAVMLFSYASSLWPNMIFNWDATQFQVDFEPDKIVWYIPKANTIDNAPVTCSGNSELSLGVKWIPFISANGGISKVVLLLAVDDLGKDDFHFYIINGLSCSVEMSTDETRSFGYICFTKTRAGNSAFWTWYLNTIVRTAVDTIRRDVKPLLPNGSVMPAFVLCDGEAIQLDAVIDDEVRRRLQESGILIGKLPASCSLIYQPADVSPLFKVVKGMLRYLTDKGLADRTSEDPAVAYQIGEAIEALNATRLIITRPQINPPVPNPSSSISEPQPTSVPTQSLPRQLISSAKKSKIIKAVLAILYSLKSKVKPDIITKGFQEAGVWPVDFRKIMDQQFVKQDLAGYNDCIQASRALVESFRNKGFITEEEMDALGVAPSRPDNNTMPRHLRPLPNNRARIVNCVASVALQQARRQSMEEQDHLTAFEHVEIQRNKALIAEAKSAKKRAVEERKAEAKAVERETKLSSLTHEEKALFYIEEAKKLDKKRRRDEKKAVVAAARVAPTLQLEVLVAEPRVVAAVVIEEVQDALSVPTSPSTQRTQLMHVLPLRTTSSGRLLRPTAPLHGDYYPCGCGCDREYLGQEMTACHGCQLAFVRKVCNSRWKCSGCLVSV